MIPPTQKIRPAPAPARILKKNSKDSHPFPRNPCGAPTHLVHEEDGLDALGDGLPEHGLGLDAHAGDAVNDHEGAVGDAERGGDLGREVNMAGRVDEVDEEGVA